MPSVCGDGKSFLYSSLTHSNAIHVTLATVGGGRETELTSGRMDWQPVCSPDGAWAVYLSHDSGVWQLMRIPTSGGKSYLAPWRGRAVVAEHFRRWQVHRVSHRATTKTGNSWSFPPRAASPVHQFDVPPDSDIFRLAPRRRRLLLHPARGRRGQSLVPVDGRQSGAPGDALHQRPHLRLCLFARRASAWPSPAATKSRMRSC